MKNEETKYEKNSLCFYHDDADGRCSAAIVRRALGNDVTHIPMDYGDEIPWRLIEQTDDVIVVDFSFSLRDMDRIRSSAELTWIDHHITALNELKSLENIPGNRALDEAACVLTWKYFFPDDAVPDAVLYIGDRDIWRHEYPETRPFGEGLFHENSIPENDDVWEPLLDGDRIYQSELISRGQILYSARMMRSERTLKSRGIEITFEGHPTLVVNTVGTGDLGELIRSRGYAIGYCYYEALQNGEITTFVTLYSDTVDVSKIAKKFGGGGHKAAAGFSFQRAESPFPSGSVVDLNS